MHEEDTILNAVLQLIKIKTHASISNSKKKKKNFFRPKNNVKYGLFFRRENV